MRSKFWNNLVSNHARLTGSAKAKSLLSSWVPNLKKFVKVFPREYRRVLLERKKAETAHIVRETAVRS